MFGKEKPLPYKDETVTVTNEDELNAAVSEKYKVIIIKNQDVNEQFSKDFKGDKSANIVGNLAVIGGLIGPFNLPVGLGLIGFGAVLKFFCSKYNDYTAVKEGDDIHLIYTEKPLIEKIV